MPTMTEVAFRDIMPDGIGASRYLVAGFATLKYSIDDAFIADGKHYFKSFVLAGYLYGVDGTTLEGKKKLGMDIAAGGLVSAKHLAILNSGGTIPVNRQFYFGDVQRSHLDEDPGENPLTGLKNTDQLQIRIHLYDAVLGADTGIHLDSNVKTITV